MAKKGSGGSGKSYHVVPNPSGGWDLKRGGAQRATIHRETKQQVVKEGRPISRNQGTEFVIHNRNGKIAQKDSHGNDPRKTPG